jgi:hypothetical protein
MQQYLKSQKDGHLTGKMTVKACNTSKQIMVQLLQTETDEKLSSKTVSQVLLIFYNSINDKTMFNLELRGQCTPTGA